MVSSALQGHACKSFLPTPCKVFFCWWHLNGLPVLSSVHPTLIATATPLSRALRQNGRWLMWARWGRDFVLLWQLAFRITSAWLQSLLFSYRGEGSYTFAFYKCAIFSPLPPPCNIHVCIRGGRRVATKYAWPQFLFFSLSMPGKEWNLLGYLAAGLNKGTIFVSRGPEFNCAVLCKAGSDLHGSCFASGMEKLKTQAGPAGVSAELETAPFLTANKLSVISSVKEGQWFSECNVLLKLNNRWVVTDY